MKITAMNFFFLILSYLVWFWLGALTALDQSDCTIDDFPEAEVLAWVLILICILSFVGTIL